MLSSVLRDAQFACREFRRSPGPFAVAAAAMALGIGGLTAVSTVVDQLLLRPLPYAHADRLAWIGMKAPISPDEFLLEADYGVFRERNAAFEAVAAMSRTNDCDLNESDPLRLSCTRVTHDLLPLLGIEPMIGRHFTADEDRPGGPQAAMLSFRFWRSRFGSDPRVLGRLLKIDGQAVRVVGILPPHFEQPNFASPDVLLTWQLNIAPGVQRSFLFVFGRLKPGVDVTQARVSTQPLFAEMQRSVPPGFRKEVTFHITGMQERQVRDYRSASVLLLGCVAGILLIACANVANLLLAWSAAREAEFAVRTALGAARGRIMRQSLTESLLLASVGAATGVAFALLLLRVLKAWAPAGAVRIQEAGLDMRLLLFTLATTLASALIFGTAPAIRAGSVASLRGTRSSGHGWRISQSLMAVQVGLSVVLLTGALLLLQSVWRMQRVSLGMSVDQVHAVRIQLGAERYPTPERASAFFEQALARLSRTPGTQVGALSDSVPLYGATATMIFSMIDIEGRPRHQGQPTGGMVVYRTVTPEYFETLGVPVVRGRTFTQEDRLGGEELTIVDEVLARRLFGGQDPIGQRIQTGRSGPWRTIVGVVRRVKNAGLTQSDDPEYYNLWRLRSGVNPRRAHLLLRSEVEPVELASFVRAEIARIDPTVPVTVTSMKSNLDGLTERPRMQMWLLGGFAAVGVLLAAIGQFGLVSYLVAERTAEIGIRMALGATQYDVLRAIGGRVMAWTFAGAACGVVASVWLAGVIQPLLFGVQPGEPLTVAAVLVVLGTASVVAILQPSMRAVRVQPASALRHD